MEMIIHKKGVWWNSFFYFMNLFSVETFIFFIISPFLVQRERSTSARQTSSSSRRMASCACPWAWRVTASLTAARTSSPTQTRPALRWRHQIITGVNILPTIEIKIKFCVCQIFSRPVSLFIIGTSARDDELFITSWCSDPLVLRAAQPHLLHPAGHHDASLHVLLRQDPHPVVRQVRPNILPEIRKKIIPKIA